MVAELDTMRAALEAMSIQVNQLAAALQTERDKTSELQKKVDGKQGPHEGNRTQEIQRHSEVRFLQAVGQGG